MSRPYCTLLGTCRQLHFHAGFLSEWYQTERSIWIDQESTVLQSESQIWPMKRSSLAQVVGGAELCWYDHLLQHFRLLQRGWGSAARVIAGSYLLQGAGDLQSAERPGCKGQLCWQKIDDT